VRNGRPPHGTRAQTVTPELRGGQKRPRLGSDPGPGRNGQLPLLAELDGAADGDLAALDHARQHAALAVELGAYAISELVHPVAGIADHRDLELSLAGPHTLADRPALDVVAVDGDVLANCAGLDVHGVEMLLRDEEDLTPGWVRMRATLESLTRDRAPTFVGIRAP